MATKISQQRKIKEKTGAVLDSKKKLSGLGHGEGVQSSQQASRSQTSMTAGGSEKKELNFDEDDGTCSMLINCRGQNIYCHRDFLCIWSPVFKTKCNPEQPGGDKATGDGDNDDEQRNDRQQNEHDEELTYTEEGLLELGLDEDPDDMKEFLSCLYPAGKEITSDNAEQIAALAYVYGTEQLKEKCEQFLIDHRQPTMELMVVAENYEMEKLRVHIAKSLSGRPLIVTEAEGEFEELNEESRMMIWRERALALEAQQDQIDEVADKQYNLLKFIAKKHKCKVIPEEKFTSVTQFSKDSRGRKVKEVIENATMVKINECDPTCVSCNRGEGRNALDKIKALDDLNVFELERKHDNITHVHFHPKK
ncbi:uncharacterized protein LOC142339959 isoform X2 [Convolutriloba macropyga]|uniref:uncharacterized protein LOC142339959 isoform X2 n=1 Tax=Convolutriloba macropyga TaxID=536237 RepID=UPI003F526037